MTSCVPGIPTDIGQLVTALKKVKKLLAHGLCKNLVGDLLSVVLFYTEKQFISF